MNYILLIINILFLVCGQIMWKAAMNDIGPWGAGTLLTVIKSPLVIGGGLIYAAATFLWLFILSRMPFSIAYPFQSLAYVIGVGLGFFIFKEVVTLTQWLGAAIIVVGVYLIAK
jgi:drug/metabolite transporter (DMT)-like permease